MLFTLKEKTDALMLLILHLHRNAREQNCTVMLTLTLYAR